MTNNKIKKMILDLMEHLDYDMWKNYTPHTSELSKEEIDAEMGELVAIVKKHLEKK